MFNQHFNPVLVYTDLAALASYAFVYIAALMLRRGKSYTQLVTLSAQRLDSPKTQFTLGLWGLALTILIPWIATMLFKTKVLGLLGLLMFPVAIWFVGSAVAVAAKWLEWGIENSSDSVTASWRPPSIALIVVASALPVLGWLVIITCLFPALGAVAEYLVIGKKSRPHPPLTESDDKSVTTDLSIRSAEDDAA